jgi:hypothetical protein
MAEELVAMLVIPGRYGKDMCDGFGRRELLRIGGSTLLGLSLPTLLQQEKAHANESQRYGGVGFGKAKHVILVYLQGGPSHLDLWDPKTDVPDNVRSIFQPIDTALPGVQFTELLPKLSRVVDKSTLLRAVSYSPNGLFNHTAAIYQMMTGYTADKVSPSGQLEQPSPKDYPNYGCHIIKAFPPTVPMLPYVMLPRPLQESNVIGKGGTAGFMGRAFDPYTLYPTGDDMDMAKMDRIRVDDLQLRPDISHERLARRAELRETVKASLEGLDRAVSKYALDEYYGKALSLVLSGKAREAFNLSAESPETRELYGNNTFGQSCLLARRLIEAGTRVVQVNWPKVANSDNHSWDVHTGLSTRMKTQSAPMLDTGLSGLLTDLDQRGMLQDTLVLAIGEFGRSPKRGVSTSGNSNSDDGRDHWPYCYTGIMAGAGIKRGLVWGKSDQTASAPVENPVHPIELLATIYHCVGMNPRRLVYNHLNQPREMVNADAVTGILS